MKSDNIVKDKSFNFAIRIVKAYHSTPNVVGESVSFGVSFFYKHITPIGVKKKSNFLSVKSV